MKYRHPHKFIVPLFCSVLFDVVLQDDCIRRLVSCHYSCFSPTHTCLTNEEKTATHRENVAKEILSTEDTYVTGLRIIQEVYLKGFKEAMLLPNPIITKEIVSKIFQGIEVIININTTFFDSLQARMQNYDKMTKLGDIFSEMVCYLIKLFKSDLHSI